MDEGIEQIESQESLKKKRLEVVDTRGPEVKNGGIFEAKMATERIEEKLDRFENLVGKKYKKEDADGVKINLVEGTFGDGQVRDGKLEVNLPSETDIDENKKKEEMQPFVKLVEKSGSSFEDFVYGSCVSTAMHESEHMIIDSRPGSNLEKSFKEATGIENDKGGYTLSFLDEGIVYGYQYEVDSQSGVNKKMDSDKSNYEQETGKKIPEDNFMVAARKELGRFLQPEIRRYLLEGKQIDDVFLKNAGEKMKEIGIEKYVVESENEKKEKMVWGEAEPVLNDWESRLTSYEEKHRVQISKSLENIAHFFGNNVPEKTNVDLHYLAQKDNSKGEPASGLVESNLLSKKDTDVIYWLGEVTRLPNDGPEQIEEEERRQTTKVIHEMIHQDFQGENEIFKSVLDKANNDAEIVEMRGELMSDQASYLEPEAELTAIYLEQYADNKLKEEVSSNEISTSQKIIEYRVDRNRFQEIYMAVVRADGEEKWKDGGPYRKTHDGWENLYTRSGENTISAASEFKNEPQPPHGLSIYELGAKIRDFSLIEKYVAEGKQLDIVFMRELYKIFLAQRGTS